jgi:hypothetical protein
MKQILFGLQAVRCAFGETFLPDPLLAAGILDLIAAEDGEPPTNPALPSQGGGGVLASLAAVGIPLERR